MPKRRKKQSHFLRGVLSGICVLIVFIVAFVMIRHYLQIHEILSHPVYETKKSIVKVLPEEFKKQLKTASPSATFHVPILMYHYIEYVQDKRDTIRMSLNVTPFVFEDQIKTLSDAGYTFMTARELGEVLDGKKQMPNKPILLTFDDGHWDFATNVLPILQKYHIKATEYVIPGFTGGSDFMSQDQVQTIAKSGLVDIGAHTVHHVALKGRPYDLVKNEIDESKSMLEDTYHISVVSFAYPDGSFDQQAVQLVKDAGFSTAVSTVPGIEQNQANRFLMFRLRPGYRTGQVLLTWLSQSSFRPF